MDNYEVGYGKPPKSAQFQKGQSGNPNGRPKGTKNLKTDLAEELQEQIVIREGDRSLRVSKQRALVKSLFAKTLAGDTRAANTLFNMIMRLTEVDEAADDGSELLSGEERELMSGLEERLLRKDNANSQGPTVADDEGAAR